MKNRLKNKGKGICFRLFKNRLLKEPLTPPIELVREIYDCKNESSMRAVVSENLRKLAIPFSEIMNRFPELTDYDDLTDLQRLSHAKKIQDCDVFIKDENGTLKINRNSNDFIEVDDNQTQAKILELRLKLKGHLRNENQTNIQVNLQTVLGQVRENREKKNGNGKKEIKTNVC